MRIKMTELLKVFGFPTFQSAFMIAYGANYTFAHMKAYELMRYATNHDVAFDVTDTDEELLELLGSVNKMVKHESFHNTRTKFYDFKKRYIKYLLKKKPELFSDVIVSDRLYNFIIGGHSLHQFKRDYPHFGESEVGKKLLGYGHTETYEPLQEPIPFVEEDYKRCLMSIALKVVK